MFNNLDENKSNALEISPASSLHLKNNQAEATKNTKMKKNTRVNIILFPPHKAR